LDLASQLGGLETREAADGDWQPLPSSAAAAISRFLIGLYYRRLGLKMQVDLLKQFTSQRESELRHLPAIALICGQSYQF